MPIEVKLADNQTLKIWHKQIQKRIIDKSSEVRADKNWNWLRIHYINGLIASMLNQSPNTYVIGIKYKTKLAPLALIFLAEKYPALYDNAKQSCFAWFLSAAPKKFLHNLLPGSSPPSLGKALIDVAITTSYMNNHIGRIGLHASPIGGPRLLDFYSRKCNLINFDKNANLPRGRGLNGNDGRYFFTDESRAFSISTSHDKYR